MGTGRFIMLKKTHFDFVLSFMHGFLYRIMFPVIASFWVFLSKFIVFVFGSLIGYLFRVSGYKFLDESNSGASLGSNFNELKEKQSSDTVDHGNCEGEDSAAMVGRTSKYEFLYRRGISGFVEEPKTESYTVHEFYMDSNDHPNFNGGILCSKNSVDADMVKIEFGGDDAKVEKTENSVDISMVDKILEDESQIEEGSSVSECESEEESALRFSFQKDFVKQIKQEQSSEEKTENSVEGKAEDSIGISIVEKAFEKPEHALRTEDFYIEEDEEPIENFIVEKVLQKPKQAIETKDVFEEEAEDSVENYVREKNVEKQTREVEGNDHLEEKFGDFFESPGIDMYLDKWKQEKEESNRDGHMFRPNSKVDCVESISCQVLANKPDLDSRPEIPLQMDGQKIENMEREIHEQNTSISDGETENLRGSINDSDDEYIELELRSENSSVMGESQSREDEQEQEESIVSPEETKEAILHEDSDSNYEEEEQDDSEHDELIERLKMELKMARTGGLPTILEEHDSPTMVQELGPMQIDEKYDYKYHIDELQRVYKSYSDKMKKLDMLNSQTMHAISLLQLKDSVQSSTSGKSSASAIKSLLSQNVWPFRQRKPEPDPATKLITDLQKDFETVYVGQVCLSWEILHWQYGKVKELLEFDSDGIREYNQVAGEFQLFQVLVQRFLENEPFQARPRVENYVKNRCAHRHLLQVPAIKDDCSGNYNSGAGEENAAVSIEMLTDIIEESMHVYWEFLRADKDEANAISKTPQQAQVAPHDPIDLELLMDVRTDLQKKERRLKEIQRSTNCILKKFQSQHQGNPVDHALFVAQVELKLVSRVLNMLKLTTDQLVWCHEKLIRISFSGRKIELDSSFTHFPC